MFILNIRNYSNEKSLIYLRLPNIFYISLAVFFIILLTGFILSSLSYVTGILTLISFAILTYRKEWKLNRNDSSIEHLRGALFFYKKNKYNFNDIDELALESVKKNNRYYLKLFFTNGDNYKILSLPPKNKDRLKDLYNFLK